MEPSIDTLKEVERRSRFAMQLENYLGPNYKEKVNKLREDLLYVIEKEKLVLLEIAYKSDLDISTISEFLRGYYTEVTGNYAKSKRPPRDNISLKTYKSIRNFVDKRLKNIGK